MLRKIAFDNFIYHLANTYHNDGKILFRNVKINVKNSFSCNFIIKFLRKLSYIKKKQ